MRSFKLSFLIALVAFVSFQTPQARAATFNWSYTDGSSNKGGGTLAATPNGGDSYLVTSITGIANGQTVTGLSSYDSPDQMVFSPSPPDIALDSLGVSFSVGTQSFQLYEDDGLYASDSPYSCRSVYCLLGPGTVGAGDPVVAVNFSLTPTPLPAALPLFAAGLGVMGLIAWGAKRKMSSARAG